jgi:hypothetical protein
VWFENPRVARPLRDDAAGAADNRLFPRDCREEARTYFVLLHAFVKSHACMSHASALCLSICTVLRQGSEHMRTRFSLPLHAAQGVHTCCLGAQRGMHGTGMLFLHWWQLPSGGAEG